MNIQRGCSGQELANKKIYYNEMRFSYQQKNNSQSMKKMYISFQLLIIYPYQIANHYEKIQLLLISINK